MIGVVAHSSLNEAANLVVAALRRSITHGMVQTLAPVSIHQTDFLVAISPDSVLGEKLLEWLNVSGHKLIIFGRMPEILRVHFGVAASEWPADIDNWVDCLPAPVGGSSESQGRIIYNDRSSCLDARHWDRALTRFDFSDEWNNLGFGAVRADGSIWSLSQALIAPAAAALASVSVNSTDVLTYCALFDDEKSSVLWVNRAVGPIDSFEWRMIERFISEWRGSEPMACRPVISEIPFGYDCAVTMRLDCDEDVASAQYLSDVYREMNVPISLAIHTKILGSGQNDEFLRNFVSSGGALLSHTATHAPNWGGTYDSAVSEAQESSSLIYSVVGVEACYAVSPFHQSPFYALNALCDVGYKGCVGGIIRNDPEFLLARGGELANLPRGFVGHSQQCMLHGDCLVQVGDPLSVYKAAFQQAFESRTLFGYLDHPFSDRYQYGWSDENVRAGAHIALVEYIKINVKRPLFLNEIEALDFIYDRSLIEFVSEGGSYRMQRKGPAGVLGFGVEFRGELTAFVDGETL